MAHKPFQGLEDPDKVYPVMPRRSAQRPDPDAPPLWIVDAGAATLAAGGVTLQGGDVGMEASRLRAALAELRKLRSPGRKPRSDRKYRTPEEVRAAGRARYRRDRAKIRARQNARAKAKRMMS